MLEVIGTRELISLDGLGIRVQGTCHWPADCVSIRQEEERGQGRFGILFLNSLSLPRTATGDSAVHWAESCAECGYPSFRLDLPGLGDSDGEIAMDLLDFINSGGYSTVVAAKVKELVKRFGLSGVIIVGHCAGTVSALFAAAASKECKGLIMMDPYFHLPQMIRPKLRQKLSHWARSSRIGGFASDIYDRLRNMLLIVEGERPPRNANFQLLSCWKQVGTAGLPILMLKAPGLKTQGTKPRVGEFDYIKHLLQLAGQKGRVTVKLIEGTDHSFANRAGRAAVRRDIENWLGAYFPISSLEDGVRSLPHSSAHKNQSEYAKPRSVRAEMGCAVEGR
ncbi:MAG: alpha/beta fold hydrolase [Terracidiphilus sp.]